VNEINYGKIDGLRECNIIEGYMKIIDKYFKGFKKVYNKLSFGKS
jgi:hypothetical protein